MEQSPAAGSGAAALAAIDPAVQLGVSVRQMPTEPTSTPVESVVENRRAAALAILDNRFTRHDYAFRPQARVNSFRVTEPPATICCSRWLTTALGVLCHKTFLRRTITRTTTVKK